MAKGYIWLISYSYLRTRWASYSEISCINNEIDIRYKGKEGWVSSK